MKRSLGSKIFDVINVIIISLISLVMLYPMLHVAFASVSDSMMLKQHSGVLLKPIGFNLNAYKTVLMDQRVWTGYRNTVVVLVGGLSFSIVLTTIAAYCISRKNLLFGKLMTGFITLTMFVNGGLIPTFLVVKSLGLLDSYWALILPGCISAYNVIILRSGFMSVPESLVEASTIDGANSVQTLVKVLIPLIMPTLAVIILYYAVGIWNSWFQATIYIRETRLLPLQVVLRDILINSDTNNESAENAARGAAAVSESIKYATVMVTVIPILVVYPSLQKYFTQGVMVGAVKG